MKRRSILKTAGGAGVVAGTLLSGCLTAADDTAYQWKYDAGGDLDAVSQGTVFLRERAAKESADDGWLSDSGPAADGEIVALDTETGDPRWTFGGRGRLSSYTELTVADGVYFSYCTDERCTELYALEPDGDERWTDGEAGSRYSPVVVDGVVYVGDDGGAVRAFDAETGADQWPRREPEPDGRAPRSGAVIDVSDAVYVETESGLSALERDDGSPRWRYDLGDEQVVIDTMVSDGHVYIVTGEYVAAVTGGDEEWHWAFDDTEVDSQTEIAGVASDHLFVFARNGRHEYRLSAFDVTTGERDWASDPIEHPNEEVAPQAALRDETVYLGADGLRALEAATGTERWHAAVDSGPIRSLTVVDENVAGDHAVFAHADESRLVSFAPDGEQTWDRSVDEPIRDYLVDDAVFAATDEGVYALDRGGGS